MPDVIAFKGVSLSRFMGQITMSTEGIYGIPLDVSATIVFLFVLFGSMLEKAGARPLLYPAGLKSPGRVQRRPGQSGRHGQRAHRSGIGVEYRQYRYHRNLHHPPDEKGRLSSPQRRPPSRWPPARTVSWRLPSWGRRPSSLPNMSTLPYIEVIKAAAIPAFASYAALFYITHIEASKLGLKGLPPQRTADFFQDTARRRAFSDSHLHAAL